MQSENIYKQMGEANELREAEHEGEPDFCGQCSRPGIVGEDLQAVTSVPSRGLERQWWICNDCREKRERNTHVIQV